MSYSRPRSGTLLAGLFALGLTAGCSSSRDRPPSDPRDHLDASAALDTGGLAPDAGDPIDGGTNEAWHADIQQMISGLPEVILISNAGDMRLGD